MRVATQLFLIAGLLCPAGVAAADRATQNRSAKARPAVIMLSVDGLASFYLDDPKAEMRTIRALAEGGASATAMKAVAPTVTWPNHTTLVTGVTPARHGVVGNDYFDRERQKPVILISDPEFDKEKLVRVPTLYDLAKTNGLSTAAIRWPATRSAKALDWTIPDVFSDELLHRSSTPSLMAECKKAGVWSDGEIVRYGTREFRVVSDEMCTRVFNYILRTHHPNLALLHLTHLDTIEHLKGPRTAEAYAAIKGADEQVRQVWQEVKRDYPEGATLLVVSDHGFTPVERLILPNIPLRDAGLLQVTGGKPAGGTVRIVAEGGAALVYVLDKTNRDAAIRRASRLLGDLDGVAKVIGPGELHEHGIAEPTEDPHAPDIVLFAREGYSFDETATGSASSVPRRDLHGTHGHDETLPCMSATFVAWGRGIKPGARLGAIHNIDVAPTVAKLLGLKLTGAEGKILSAALAD
jgi:predicted AlkP superfamily pyrophosphatase or phosphodiesterase